MDADQLRAAVDALRYKWRTLGIELTPDAAATLMRPARDLTPKATTDHRTRTEDDIEEEFYAGQRP